MTSHDLVLIGALGTLWFVPLDGNIKLIISIGLLILGLFGFPH